MSVPSATIEQVTSQSARTVSRTREAPVDKARVQSSKAPPAAQDSVSLSPSVKSAYQAPASDKATPSRATASTTRQDAKPVDPSESRDLSSQMRRMSSEATHNRAAEQTSAAADANLPVDPSLTAPLSDTLTADEQPQASFSALADGLETATSNGGTPEGDNQSANTASTEAGEASTPSGTGAAVDSQAGLVNLDHALGRIVHNTRVHGANFESLTAATRLSVRQRESLAVAHSEGGGHELASATAQAGRPRTVQKNVSTVAAPAAASARENKAYTRPARKA